MKDGQISRRWAAIKKLQNLVARDFIVNGPVRRFVAFPGEKKWNDTLYWPSPKLFDEFSGVLVGNPGGSCHATDLRNEETTATMGPATDVLTEKILLEGIEKLKAIPKPDPIIHNKFTNEFNRVDREFYDRYMNPRFPLRIEGYWNTGEEE